MASIVKYPPAKPFLSKAGVLPSPPRHCSQHIFLSFKFSSPTSPTVENCLFTSRGGWCILPRARIDEEIRIQTRAVSTLSNRSQQNVPPRTHELASTKECELTRAMSTLSNRSQQNAPPRQYRYVMQLPLFSDYPTDA